MIKRIEYFEIFQDEMKGWYREKKRNKISILKYTSLTLILLVIFTGAGFCLNHFLGGFVIEDILDKEGKVFQISEYGDYSEPFVYKYVYNKNNYIIYDSQDRYLEEDELKEFTLDELALIRNEIYAMNNMEFKSEPYLTYFNNKSWYVGYCDNVEFDYLSEEAKANIKLIKDMEKRK